MAAICTVCEHGDQAVQRIWWSAILLRAEDYNAAVGIEAKTLQLYSYTYVFTSTEWAGSQCIKYQLDETLIRSIHIT